MEETCYMRMVTNWFSHSFHWTCFFLFPACKQGKGKTNKTYLHLSARYTLSHTQFTLKYTSLNRRSTFACRFTWQCYSFQQTSTCLYTHQHTNRCKHTILNWSNIYRLSVSWIWPRRFVWILPKPRDSQICGMPLPLWCVRLEEAMTDDLSVRQTTKHNR